MTKIKEGEMRTISHCGMGVARFFRISPAASICAPLSWVAAHVLAHSRVRSIPCMFFISAAASPYAELGYAQCSTVKLKLQPFFLE